MTGGLDALSDKERQALRLIGRGHDAKSCARELGLSVHTVNERLRIARRKLCVTSSREAARLLLAAETPDCLGDKDLGDAPVSPGPAQVAASAHRRSARVLRAAVLGVAAMSLMIALLLPASPLTVLTPAPQAPAPAVSAAAQSNAAARAAERFLSLIDESRWEESYAATGAEFRKRNTLERWSEVSQQARPPLGRLVSRTLVGNEYVPAPPEGYRLVRFRSAYAGGKEQTESVSLAWEDDAWRVTGIVFD